jgi:hypothetical protein
MWAAAARLNEVKEGGAAARVWERGGESERDSKSFWQVTLDIRVARSIMGVCGKWPALLRACAQYGTTNSGLPLSQFHSALLSSP